MGATQSTIDVKMTIVLKIKNKLTTPQIFEEICAIYKVFRPMIDNELEDFIDNNERKFRNGDDEQADKNPDELKMIH